MDIQELEKKEPVRKRHGFVTFWLVYILMNGLSTLLAYTIFKEEIQELLKIQISDEFASYLMGLGVLNAVSAILLLNWKKIGFHGLVVSNIVNMYVSGLMNSGIEATLFGLMQIGILYMVLQMKKEDKSTWEWLS